MSSVEVMLTIPVFRKTEVNTNFTLLNVHCHVNVWLYQMHEVKQKPSAVKNCNVICHQTMTKLAFRFIFPIFCRDQNQGQSGIPDFP
jgi:hypothetical protein